MIGLIGGILIKEQRQEVEHSSEINGLIFDCYIK